MTTKPRVLVLDDDSFILREVTAHLEDRFVVESATTFDEAMTLLRDVEGVERFSVAVVDMCLREGPEGVLTFVEKLSKQEERPEIVILTAYPDNRVVPQ